MPAWMTPLLWVLVSSPARACRSSTQTERPRRAIATADARPTTPAPTTATSMRSMGAGSVQWPDSSRGIRDIRMAKRALITGITGQDGSYLAELLLDKGYEVVGMMRRSSAPNLWRIQHIVDRI